MNTLKTASLAFAMVLFASLGAQAEDLNAIFKRVNDLVAEKNFSKALDELDWAKKEVEKMHMQKLQEFFPDSLAGYTGQKFEGNSALGFSNLERSYTQGNKKVKISITGGTGQGAAALSGLAQMGRMAAMLQGSSLAGGNETVRIQGKTATVESPEGGVSSLTVMMDSGSILKLEGSKSVKTDDLKSMAEALKLVEMDSYLKGAK